MITVRAMQVKDAEQVSELEKMIFSQPWSYQGFVDSLSLPNTVFLVAEENNKILGYIGMYLSIDEGEITNVAVSPEMRCHGIGGITAGGCADGSISNNIYLLKFNTRVSLAMFS